MPPKAAGSELQKLLAAHSSLELRGEKVLCSLSGHSMPARPAEVLVYLNGRKYKQLAKAKAEGKYQGRTATIDAAVIRGMKADGIGPAEIAKRLGVARSSVYRVLDGAKS